LSPVEYGCQLDPLDAIFNSKAKEHAIEMGFHGTFRHVQIARDF
jgi:hypothetical protein